VPPGALIAFLQKGLQYVEIESHLQEDGAERACDEPFHLLAPHVCRLRAAGAGGAAAPDAAGGAALAAALAAAEAPAADVTLLAGHGAEAYAAAWSGGGALATGGADAAARLWRVDAAGGSEVGAVMRHAPPPGASGGGKDAPCDVAALAWAPDGARLATAGSDGRARVWAAGTGALEATLVGHTAAVNAVQWAPGGGLVATASGAHKRARRRACAPRRARVLTPPPPLPTPTASRQARDCVGLDLG